MGSSTAIILPRVDIPCVLGESYPRWNYAFKIALSKSPIYYCFLLAENGYVRAGVIIVQVTVPGFV